MTPTLDQIRTASEADIRDALERVDARTRRKLVAALERYGRAQDIPQDVWDDIKGDTENALILYLLLLSIASDSWTTSSLRDQGLLAAPIGDVRGYANKAAARAATLAGQTTDTIRDRLGRRIEQARLDPRGGLGELTPEGIDQSIDDVLTSERREGMATDATTGGISDGQRGAGDRGGQQAGQSVTVEMRWQTERDDKVCPRCAPLHEQPEEVWGKVFPNGPGPEAHPNCRCNLRPVVVVQAASNAA